MCGQCSGWTDPAEDWEVDDGQCPPPPDSIIFSRLLRIICQTTKGRGNFKRGEIYKVLKLIWQIKCQSSAFPNSTQEWTGNWRDELLKSVKVNWLKPGLRGPCPGGLSKSAEECFGSFMGFSEYFKNIFNYVLIVNGIKADSNLQIMSLRGILWTEAHWAGFNGLWFVVEEASSSVVQLKTMFIVVCCWDDPKRTDWSKLIR